MVAKDWKIAVIEGAVKNGPWFCLYLILTCSFGYGLVEFGRISGASIRDYIVQTTKNNQAIALGVQQNGEHINQTLAIMADAKEMMRETPRQREQTNTLLKELVDGMRATAEELREFRKNELALPSISNDGGE